MIEGKINYRWSERSDAVRGSIVKLDDYRHRTRTRRRLAEIFFLQSGLPVLGIPANI